MITAEDLPWEVTGAASSAVQSTVGQSAAPVRTLADVEREHILAVMQHTGANQTAAARLLGIGTTTLYRRLKHYRAPSDEAG